MEVPRMALYLILWAGVVTQDTVLAKKSKDKPSRKQLLVGHTLTFLAIYEDETESRIDYTCAHKYVVEFLANLAKVQNYLNTQCNLNYSVQVTVGKSTRVSLNYNQMKVHPVINITSPSLEVTEPRLWKNLSSCAHFVENTMTENLTSLERALKVNLQTFSQKRRCPPIAMTHAQLKLGNRKCIGVRDCTMAVENSEVVTSYFTRKKIKLTELTTPVYMKTMKKTIRTSGRPLTTKFIMKITTAMPKPTLPSESTNTLKVSPPANTHGQVTTPKAPSLSGVVNASNTSSTLKTSFLLVVMVTRLLTAYTF